MNRRKALIVPLLVLPVLALGAAVILYRFPPEQTAFYPKCLLYSWTGLQCPGCGGLRAAHHLLHGHFTTALHYNPLVVGLLPLLLALAIIVLRSRWTGRPVRHPFTHPVWVWLLVAGILLFGVLRNF